MPVKISPNAPCPCHSGLKYKKCCRPLHQGRPAQSLTALMRSRYSAYALQDNAYIMQTTHPDSPHQQTDHGRWQADILAFCTSTQFVDLEIISDEEDGPQAWVTFRATLLQGDTDASYTERSFFKKQHDRWMYISGEPD